MKQLVCELCGGTDLVKDGGVFVCQSCGIKYSAEEARKMMAEGAVEVTGTVRVDESNRIGPMLRNARRLYDGMRYGECYAACAEVLRISPEEPIALALSALADNGHSCESSEWSYDQLDRELRKAIDLMFERVGTADPAEAKRDAKRICDAYEAQERKYRSACRLRYKIAGNELIGVIGRIDDTPVQYRPGFIRLKMEVEQLKRVKDVLAGSPDSPPGRFRKRVDTLCRKADQPYDDLKRKQEEEERRQAIDAWWGQHQDEFSMLESELDSIKSELKKNETARDRLASERRATEREMKQDQPPSSNKDKYESLNAQAAALTLDMGRLQKERSALDAVEMPAFPSQSLVDRLSASIKKSEGELSSLGFFSGRRKRELNAILENERAELDTAQKSLNAERLEWRTARASERSQMSERLEGMRSELSGIQAAASRAKSDYEEEIREKWGPELERIDRELAMVDESNSSLKARSSEIEAELECPSSLRKRFKARDSKNGRAMSRRSKEPRRNGKRGAIRVKSNLTLGSYGRAGASLRLHWTAIDVDRGKREALLLCDQIIKSEPYSRGNRKASWDTCKLANWLNTEFIRESFNKEETDCLIERQGLRRVFLLSDEEFKKYRKRGHIKPPEIPSEIASPKRGSWWLRTSAESEYRAMHITENNRLSTRGMGVGNDSVGVRPAIWVRLDLLP